MSQIFFIADLHIGHRNILKYRSEFSSVKEHDGTQELKRKINLYGY